MANALREQGLVDFIRTLSARGESGRLQLASGMTDGAVFFDRGQLIDATFGKLTGFQAINALASLRDVTFSFDPSIAPSAQSSISAHERILLQDFFGIGGVHEEPQHLPFEDDVPTQVVPLTEVDDREILESREDSVTLDSSLPPPFVRDEPSIPPLPLADSPATKVMPGPAHYVEAALVSDDDEATLVRRKKRRTESAPITYSPSSGSSPRPALFVAMLAIVVAAAAIALIYRFRQRSLTTPATVQTSSPTSDPQVPNSAATPAGVADLTGNWNVINTIEKSSYQPYQNMEVGFELAINQTGNEFTGKGQKVSENGRSLAGPSRTPIVVQGTIDGDKVEATFSESGARRNTSGRFVWRIDRAKGGLTGRFATTAARSSGRSAATKRS